MSGVQYTFVAIVEQEDVDETWVPRIVDKAGTVAWDPTEGDPKSFRATGLTVYRGSPNSDGRLLKVDDVSINVYITSARLVAVCRKFDKGGGWFGGVAAMVVFNAVSKARAAIRSHGKFLVGQMRWPWLSDVGYTEKTGWLSDNQLRVVAMDERGAWIFADFKLPKDVNARAVAERILASAAAAREAEEVPALPKYDPQSKKFALVGLPGAKKALASTAYPSPDGTGTMDPAPAQLDAAPAQLATESPAAQEPIPVGEHPPMRCGDCGKSAAEGARFCRFCGGHVVADEPQPEPDPEILTEIAAGATPTGDGDAPSANGEVAHDVVMPPPAPDLADSRPAEAAPLDARAEASAGAGGTPTQGEAVAVAITPGAEAPDQPDATPDRCSQCGRGAPGGAKFCRFCGGPVAAVATPASIADPPATSPLADTDETDDIHQPDGAERETSTDGAGDAPIPFSERTPAQRGDLDPAIEYVARAESRATCDFVSIGLDEQGHPTLPDGEEFVSRWLAAATVLYDAAIGANTPACHGGCFIGVTTKRLVGCWYNGFQFLEDGTGDLDDDPASWIAFAWTFDTINQIFVEGTPKRRAGMEAKQLRLFGGSTGAQLVVEAAMPADAQWLGPHERSLPDPQAQYLALGMSLAQANARYRLRNDPADRVYLQSIAAGRDDHWLAGNSPFKDGEAVVVLQMDDPNAAEAVAVAPSTEATSTAASQADATADRCSQCGREAPDGSKFCRFCGGPVAAAASPMSTAEPVRPSDQSSPGSADAAPSPRTCANCGTPNAPEHRFCRSCGQPVSAAPTRTAEHETSRSASPPASHDPATQPLASAATPPARRSSKALVISVLVGAVLLAGGGGAYLLLGHRDNTTATASARNRQTQPAEQISGSTTSQPASTPTTTAPQPTVDSSLVPDGPPSQFENDIRNLLLDFHQALVDRDYRAAWRLLSARKRSKVLREDGYPKWRSAQASLSPYLDPSGVEVTVKDVNRQTGVALVDVSGMGWSGPHARCSEWSGLTWVKYEGGQWRYDPGYSTTPQRERDWKKRFHELLGASC